jgi:uridine kinase
VSLQVGEARAGVVTAVAVGIDAVTCSHPVRVAIDGPDAAGKTTLADELAVVLRARGREVIRASIDGFHRPRSQRHRQGPESPCGYYEDSFDQERLLAELLHPLGDAGSRLYRTRIFDYRADAPVRAEPMRASADAILLFDGVFLLRPELAGAWDHRIFVTVSPREVIRRARGRDAELFGSPGEAERRYKARYLPAQQHYLQTIHPDQLADVVLENNDPAHPTLLARN